MREFTRGFYKTGAWRQCRAAYLKSVGGLCEDCLKDGVYRAADTVHHMTWLTPDNIDDPSVTLGWDNLKAVCRDCHAKEHARERRYKLDEFGRIAPLIR